jgi:hypothetical protein
MQFGPLELFSVSVFEDGSNFWNILCVFGTLDEHSPETK